MSRLKPFLWWLVKFVVVPYSVVLLIVVAFEERLLFPGWGDHAGNWSPAIPVEDAVITTADGVQIHGWYLPHDNPQAYLLWCPGNGGNISIRVFRLPELHRMGFAAMVFDYRGYGQSQGAPTESGLYADARAARAWLARRAGIAEHDIVLVGESLGGGVAVDLAANDGCRGLVLESTYSQIPDVGASHFPWLPCQLLMRNRFNSVGKIGRYQGPLLQCHGDRDVVIPLAIGERLFAAANEPKQFVLLPGVNHDDRYTPKWDAAFAEFVRGLPPMSRSALSAEQATQEEE